MSYKIKSLLYLICFAIFALTYYALDNEGSNDTTEIVQLNSDIDSSTGVN